ncbi:MAG: hypothetical protein K9M75_08270 [Phycisphaerae bacterium]|nr:hypothetical protein [Phycisphaerae bacterium]
MPRISKHTKWFKDSGERLTTSDGKTVEVWEFCYQKDDDILRDWAKHFRNHYCSDDEIDDLRDGTGLSRSDYLTNMVFPDSSKGFGPRIRSGDFAEILVADFLEYIMQYWVPRFRY